MPIVFENIPDGLAVPLFYAELRGAQTPYSATLKLMLVGHKNTTGGVAVAGNPYRLSGDEAARLFGKGSMLEAMYRKARMQSLFVEIWGVAAAPDVDAIASVGSFTIGAVPAANGNLQAWIAGYPVSAIVRTTDTTSGMAIKLRNAINAATHLPVTASIDGVNPAKVNLTCKWKGATGNIINLEKSVYGVDNPVASVVTVAAMAGGLGNASLSTALAGIEEEKFDVLAVGTQGNSEQVAELDAYFDHDTGRWSPFKQTFGHAFLGFESSFSTVMTYGATLNCPHVTIMAMYNSPTPQWEWAAAVSARVTANWAQPPKVSLPLHKIELSGIIAARNPADYFSIEERQGLLTNGLSTHTVDADGTVRIERLVTLYKFNKYGDPDQSWSNAGTMFQLMYLVRAFRTRITGKYARAALTDRDTGIEGFVSPEQLRDELIAEYGFQESQGLVENTEIFAQALVVERNATEPDRVDAMARADLVNELGIFALLVESNLSSNTIKQTA